MLLVVATNQDGKQVPFDGQLRCERLDKWLLRLLWALAVIVWAVKLAEMAVGK